MKQKELKDREEFMKALNKGNTCYLRKPRSWQKIHFYWEDKNEQWFMNKVYDIREDGQVKPDVSKGVWIIAKDLDHHIDTMEREGYKYYLKIDDDE
jgi:hypothetical protein